MDIDLPPKDWRSSDGRAKPREPFWGSGWSTGLGVLLGIIGATIAVESGYGPVGSGVAGIIGAIIGASAAQIGSGGRRDG